MLEVGLGLCVFVWVAVGDGLPKEQGFCPPEGVFVPTEDSSLATSGTVTLKQPLAFVFEEPNTKRVRPTTNNAAAKTKEPILNSLPFLSFRSFSRCVPAPQKLFRARKLNLQPSIQLLIG